MGAFVAVGAGSVIKPLGAIGAPSGKPNKRFHLTRLGLCTTLWIRRAGEAPDVRYDGARYFVGGAGVGLTKNAFVAAAMACALLVLAMLPGCGPRGSDTALHAAQIFYEAVASGNLENAKAVSVAPITERDMARIRLALFASESTLTPSALDVQQGVTSVQGATGENWMALYGYTTFSGDQKVTDEDASDRYQVAVKKVNGVWVVSAWEFLTTP